jgi:DHA2 family multidrug resistance protein
MGVMVGPIIGPTLGGWLTEDYNWRWVFYINLPIGAVALFGIASFMRESVLDRSRRFDFFGFVTLSLAIGLLQLCLDRGELKDWFGSTEVRVEAIGALISACFFLGHTMTVGRDSFFDTRILRDRNYVSGILVIFTTGLVLYATRALLPPMLQQLMDYPVVTTGLVMAPSGAATMLAMLIAGRLTRIVDVRWLMTFGFTTTIVSLWQMSNYTLVLSQWDIVWPGIVQGFGLGFIFVPLSAVTFSTLAAQLRPAGTSIFSLSRNVGSSVGISIVEALLTRGTQVEHATLAEQVTPYNPLLTHAAASSDPMALSMLNDEITRQATIVSYLNDFRFMMVLALITMPLIAFIRPIRRRPDVAIGHAME